MPHIFYVNEISGDTAFFDEEETHHFRVVRAVPGDIIEATDGKGRIYRIELVELKKRWTRGRIVEIARKEAPPKPEVTALVGASRWQRMKFVVEKSVELGVRSLVVFKGDLSHPGSEKEELDKYRRTAIEAMKQSRNIWLPKIIFYPNLEEALQKTTYKSLIVADMIGEKPFQKLCAGLAQPVAAVVGPQEGFSEKEKELLKNLGALFLNLSQNILRMETAFIVLVAFAMNSVRR